MNGVSKTARQAALCMVVSCLAMMATPKASAVPTSELLRVEQSTNFQGVCCFSWQDKVRISEASTVAPVIVTFSTDYQATDIFFVGLSVNGRPCQFFGSGTLLPFGVGDGSGDFSADTFQWFIQPSDGLVKGNNTLTVCGGADTDPTAVVFLGFRTLAVRISK
jgi:hypothetical protein